MQKALMSVHRSFYHQKLVNKIHKILTFKMHLQNIILVIRYSIQYAKRIHRRQHLKNQEFGQDFCGGVMSKPGLGWV